MESLIFLMHKSFVVMLFVCLSVKYASSIECYECKSFDANSACSNWLNPTTITTCREEKNWCVSAKLNGYGVNYIERACMNINDNENKMTNTIEEANGIQALVTMCNTDLCNGAGDNLPTKTILIISAMFLAYFYNIGY